MCELMRNAADEDIFELETPSPWSTEAIDFLNRTETVSTMQLSEVSTSRRDDGAFVNFAAPIFEESSPNERIDSIGALCVAFSIQDP